MNIDDKYFSIFIEDKSYYIERSSKPYSHDSAIKTLEKIEFIVKNKLEYHPAHKKDSLKLIKDLIKEPGAATSHDVLTAITKEVHQGYTQKQRKINWVFRKIFSKEKKVTRLHASIDAAIASSKTPPEALPSYDALLAVAEHLPVKSLLFLSQVNKEGYTYSDDAIILRAKELGYPGKDSQKARQYLKKLSEEVHLAIKEKLLPKSFIIKVKGKIDFEKTCFNLKYSLSLGDIFFQIAKPHFYSFDFHAYGALLTSIGAAKRTEEAVKAIPAYLKNQAVIGASQKGNWRAVDFLLKCGAIPTIEAHSGNPLSLACTSRSLKTVKLLIASGAPINILSRFPPLHAACSRAYSNYVHIHSPPSLPSYSGLPLNLKMIKFLLDLGADPRAQNWEGFTPLHLSVQACSIKAVKMLLEKGAEINAPDRNGQTALFMACKTLNADLVELLLKNGADPTLKDIYNCLPLMYMGSSYGPEADKIRQLLSK